MRDRFPKQGNSDNFPFFALISKLLQIPRKIKVHTKEKQEVKKEDPIIVQSYIPNPLLIHGYKFDFRLYVLVTSVTPLRIYLYRDGMVRWVR